MYSINPSNIYSYTGNVAQVKHTVASNPIQGVQQTAPTFRAEQTNTQQPQIQPAQIQNSTLRTTFANKEKFLIILASFEIVCKIFSLPTILNL